MTEIDTKIYELFAIKDFSEGHNVGGNGIYKIDMPHYIIDGDFNKGFDGKILGYEPQLHDVFRVAKEKNINLVVYQWINQIAFNDKYNNEKEIKRIPYNPTLSLMNQTDSTKQEIINLFK